MIYIAIALFFAAIAVLNLIEYRHQRDGSWREMSRYRMRRLTKAGWEYRPMTRAEIEAYQDAVVW